MAKITQAQWKRYISKLRQINDKAADDFLSEVVSHGGYGNIERQKLIDLAYGISTKYGEASAALSAEMYDAIAELSKAAVPAALPAETASYSDVARTVNGILKNTGSDKVLAQGVGRLVKRAGADTMLQNAYRDRPKGKGSKRRHSGAEVAWVPSGDTCPFCLTLASKGWQNQTEWGANNHAEHIHANCDCTYAVRFNNNFSVEGYDPDEYKKMYDDAEGSTPNEKINSMRRMQYQDPATREKINAQKRAAYAERNKQHGLAAGASNKGPVPEHDPPTRIDVLVDGTDRREVLLKHEKMIADEPIENAIVVTRDGEVYRCYGTVDGVYPEVDLGDKLIGADVTHNHPPGSNNEYSFSDQDIDLFGDYRLNSLRGIDEKFSYELNHNPERPERQQSIFDLDEYSSRHSIVIEIAQRRGYGYKRTNR